MQLYIVALDGPFKWHGVKTTYVNPLKVHILKYLNRFILDSSSLTKEHNINDYCKMNS